MCGARGGHFYFFIYLWAKTPTKVIDKHSSSVAELSLYLIDLSIAGCGYSKKRSVSVLVNLKQQ